MIKIKYICTGSCGGSVSEEEFKKGKNKCQNTKCEKKGRHLEKRKFCPDCDVFFNENEFHSCE